MILEDRRGPQSPETHIKPNLCQCPRLSFYRPTAGPTAPYGQLDQQVDDDTLLNHARRIQVRAVRKMGELLEAIEPATGKTKAGGDSPFSRTKAAENAGLSRDQQNKLSASLVFPRSCSTNGLSLRHCRRRWKLECKITILVLPEPPRILASHNCRKAEPPQ